MKVAHNVSAHERRLVAVINPEGYVWFQSVRDGRIVCLTPRGLVEDSRSSNLEDLIAHDYMKKRIPVYEGDSITLTF